MKSKKALTIIAFVTGGVGLVAGAVGLGIGLTREGEVVPEPYPVPVPTEGFSVKLHYDNKTTTMPGALIKLEEAPSVPKDWITKESHLAAIGWYFDQAFTQQATYPFSLTEDEDLYLKTEVGMGKVYLHTTEEPTSSTYNGTEDWYYASQYASQGNGFLKRDLPQKDHYKKLGWALTKTDFEPTSSWPAPKVEDVVQDKDWPSDGIRPEVNRIAHLYPMYEQIDFQITFDTDGGNAISPIWSNGHVVAEEDQPDDPILANNKFLGWVYADDYGEHQKDTEVDWNAIDQDMTFKAKWDKVAWKITLKEVVGTDNNWSVLAEQDGVTTLTPGALKDALDKVGNREGYAPAGWSQEEHSLGTDWELKDLITGELKIEDDTALYVMYYSKDMNIKINLNGATFNDGTTTYSDSYDLSTYGRELTNAGELYNDLEDAGTITPPTTSPNFVGWEEKGSTTLITYPYPLTKDTKELTMVWTDTSKFSVTFDAGGGEFYYEREDKIVKTTPLITYTVDLNSTIWTSEYKPTITNVYKEALEEWECIATNPLRREGYVDNEETPWSVAGAPVSNPANYLLTGSATISKLWVAETSSGNWDQDSFALICAIAEDTTPTGDPEYPTKLEKTYSTKANDFVGKTKEISIPLLDPENTFTIRVIGVDKDYLSDNSGKAYLTFEFVDCPMASCYAPDGKEARDARYNNSMVKKVSLPYLINIMPASLTSHFQMVKKAYLTDNTSKAAIDCTTLETESTNLFILSAYEYGGSTSGSASVESGKGSDYVFRYDYYNINSDGTVSNRAHTLNGFNTPVWTRTPSGGIAKRLTDCDVCFIGEVGGDNPNKITCYDPVYGYGVAPAFCIGIYPAQ